MDCYDQNSHRRSHVQSDGHHIRKGILSGIGIQCLPAEDVIGDGADGQGPLARYSGVHVEARGLHLNAQDTHFVPALIEVGIGVIEYIGGQEIAYLVPYTQCLALADRGAEKVKIGYGGEAAVQVVLGGVVGIGAGAHADDDVAELNIVGQASCGADADDALHTEEIVQLVGINADGGHTHAAGHDRDGSALVGARVALNAADVVDQAGIGQKIFGDKLRPQGITGHEDGFGKVGGCGLDMGGRVVVGHRDLL